MTKPVTGAAAMLLIEDGKLKLDQNIADFLPGFAQPRVALDPGRSLESRPAKGPITVRHLLTHPAGLTAASIHGHFVPRQIGSAAGRERVGQYVYASGVAEQ